MWYVSSNRDETRFENPDRFDLRRWSDRGGSPEASVSPARTEHQAFGAGGRHFCLGTALARLELRVMLEETLRRYPKIELAGAPLHAESLFLNQLKTLPVRLAD
jgi:cholest-4-en-3-one 26-monooxygenase